MKDRYKFILFFGATCILIFLVYFWHRSANHEPEHPSLSNHSTTSTIGFIGTPAPMRFKPNDKKNNDKYKLKDNVSEDTTTEFTINTLGCKIPLARINFMEYSKADKRNKNIFDCGNRAVFLKKINVNTIQVFIDMTKLRKYFLNESTSFSCDYQFFNESTRPGLKSWKKLNLNGPIQNITLETDFVNVRCRCVNNVTYYDDLFAFIKRKITQNEYIRRCKENYNVLMLGMDSMSLARLKQTMPKTSSFLYKKSAISFRGYHKVGDNTFPNLMAALSGYNLQTIRKHCQGTIDQCDIIWKKFQNIGYTTAYGEDFLGLPETFSRHYKFHKSPTDHHIKPMFLRDETEINKTLICTGKAFAGQQLLDYATDFVRTYQYGRFFGIFWINSFSHNDKSRPQDADGLLKSFFNYTIGTMDILKNTFVIFFSDQGLRFGKHRMKVESYYDERLPFLFILPPRNFKANHDRKLYSLVKNRQRLVTPYDLYNTLYDIYRLSSCRDWYTSVSHACPKCQSLFTPVSTTRRCQDVAINDKWCSCHKLNPLNQQDFSKGMNSVLLAVSKAQNRTKDIKTRPGWLCADISLDKVIRTHFYYNEIDNSLYFIVAFTTIPGNITFEARVFRGKIVNSLSVISPYTGLGHCTADTNIRTRLYCVCEKNKACFE